MSFTVTDCQTVFPTLPRPRSLSQSRVRDVMAPSLPSRGKHPHLAADRARLRRSCTR